MKNKNQIQTTAPDFVEIKISNGILILESHLFDTTPFTIYTIYNQEIAHGVVEFGTNSISLGYLNTGVYIFKMLDFSYTLIVD